MSRLSGLAVAVAASLTFLALPPVTAHAATDGRASAQLSGFTKSGKRTVTAWYSGSELLMSKTGKTSVKLKR
ncbi:MAG TPA: hypothetical protein PKV13_06600 [Propionicimonas sp.]|nr:hypothetical protein [Propionicimonas sp.]HRA06276.1 hypothetical protein [Propionicimonas sp.]